MLQTGDKLVDKIKPERQASFNFKNKDQRLSLVAPKNPDLRLSKVAEFNLFRQKVTQSTLNDKTKVNKNISDDGDLVTFDGTSVPITPNVNNAIVEQLNQKSRNRVNELKLPSLSRSQNPSAVDNKYSKKKERTSNYTHLATLSYQPSKLNKSVEENPDLDLTINSAIREK